MKKLWVLLTAFKDFKGDYITWNKLGSFKFGSVVVERLLKPVKEESFIFD